MKTPSVPIEQLKNIGPTIARRLREIGIRTNKDLKSVGAVSAYRRICAKHPRQTIPVCYYLYSLEGALLNRHWDRIGTAVKDRLVSQVRKPRRTTRQKN